MNKPTVWILLISILWGELIVNSKKLKCHNGGLPILTRTIQQPYELKQQCLCPFNYYGIDCNEYRSIYCYVNSAKVSEYSPRFSEKAQLEFQMQCMLKKLDSDSDQLFSGGNYWQLPISSKSVEEDYQSNNYYIDPSYEIIWANRSAMFDAKGELIKDPNDTRSDEQILGSYPKYQFTYNSSFFGVPIYNTKFVKELRIIKFTNSSIDLGAIDVDLRVKTPVPPDPEKTIIGRFNLSTKSEWIEYQMIRLQFAIKEQYGDYGHASHLTTINTARWRLVDPYLERGTPINTSTQIPSWVWVVLCIALVVALVLGGRYLGEWYRKWRASKNTKIQLKEQSEGGD